jgi:hypothetical protein
MTQSVIRNSERKSLSLISRTGDTGSQRNSGCPMSRFWDMGLRRAATLTLVLLLSAVMSPPLHAQGCSQCRDNTAATPPATQRAYRHAIILMAIAASGIFLGTVVLLKRQP